MKILIIHPDDRSTDFLEPIYESLLKEDDDRFFKHNTLITGGISKNKVRELIDEHDQIIMLGHGSPSGLFSMGNFTNSGAYIIDETMLTVLGTKPNIYIWCNAHNFINRYYLKGFYTGMFISEVEEAGLMGLKYITQEIVDESNNEFSKILGNVITEPIDEIYTNVKDEYSNFALGEFSPNEVALYNVNRLYYK